MLGAGVVPYLIIPYVVLHLPKEAATLSLLHPGLYPPEGHACNFIGKVNEHVRLYILCLTRYKLDKRQIGSGEYVMDYRLTFAHALSEF